MEPKSPEDICRLFKQYIREGDLEGVLSVYDPEVVFLNRNGETKRLNELRSELSPFVNAKAVFDYDIKQIIQAGDIALMHTHWKISAPQETQSYAIEVARRQPDGSWRWLIGDPFTIGKYATINKTQS